MHFRLADEKDKYISQKLTMNETEQRKLRNLALFAVIHGIGITLCIIYYKYLIYDLHLNRY